MNSIDIVTPTMWCDENFIDYLKHYCDYSAVKSIILIDNQKSKRPQDPILSHPKIHLVGYHRNIYVNPAWNEGYYRSSSDVLCILNDDVFLKEEVFDTIAALDMTNIDIIGARFGTDSNEQDEFIKLNLIPNKPIGMQSYGFGVCIFIKRSVYKPIPSLYKIWYGDDHLIQNCKNVYVLKTNKLTGEVSKTVNTKGPIQKRIDLDVHNAYKYNRYFKQ